ncbi:hypothetical protein [Mucilaginibacter polytrichastri]|uniref:Uncharacterized protein n=1 Tax=Mucilaginibacter polytrichastri TaxID=1302689 RepID=A0A1Q5ZTE7_9SPHI|nr:hypothetical protein [Mucilaginibacter polytrichastri]OKS85034.1 hypothetical protein RG47T_0472 [Mucilaginibacter polytrichastri]
MKPNTTKSSNNISGAQRPIDVYFPLYNQRYPSVGDKLILSIVLLFLFFSIMGLVWIIPFPQLNWLGTYKGYFSWASFFIAGSVFYWYKQSPILSYFLLLLMFAFSYGASQLAEIGALVGPPVWTICGPIALAALITLFLISRKRQVNFVSSIFRLPVWLVSFLAKGFGAKI